MEQVTMPETKTIYCIALEGGAVGGVDWFFDAGKRVEKHYDDNDVWFDLDVPADASSDDITKLADEAMWEKSYEEGRADCRSVDRKLAVLRAVAAAMAKVDAYRPLDSTEPLWWNDGHINGILNAGVAAGYLSRLSTTQVYWTESGRAVWKTEERSAALKERFKRFFEANGLEGILPHQLAVAQQNDHDVWLDTRREFEVDSRKLRDATKVFEAIETANDRLRPAGLPLYGDLVATLAEVAKKVPYCAEQDAAARLVQQIQSAGGAQCSALNVRYNRAALGSLSAELADARLQLEGHLSDAQAKLRAEFGVVPEDKVKEAIRLHTRVSKLVWVLEMLPNLESKPVLLGQTSPTVTVESLSKEISEAHELFERRAGEVTSAIAKGDLSLAQFPRLGDEALAELTESVAVLHQVLQIVPRPDWPGHKGGLPETTIADRYRAEQLRDNFGSPAEFMELMAHDAASRNLPKARSLTLKPSGRFITDDQGRKVAEMFQPGELPGEQEVIKSRIVASFNALPDIVGVLLRADKEGGLWQALCNEGIADSYDLALSRAVKALGDEGIADVAYRYELDSDAIRAKVGGDENVLQHDSSPSSSM